ncbi:MAG: hypothetical protein ABSD42_11295 [Candidatus Bathyarchaeia archaeon]|jgi:hypothetical protein
MNKSEALAVLHEIFETCNESLIINCVSLDPKPKVSKDPDCAYLIRMKCDLDSNSRSYVQPILDKHKLAMKEENGHVIIYAISAD